MIVFCLCTAALAAAIYAVAFELGRRARLRREREVLHTIGACWGIVPVAGESDAAFRTRLADRMRCPPGTGAGTRSALGSALGNVRKLPFRPRDGAA